MAWLHEITFRFNSSVLRLLGVPILGLLLAYSVNAQDTAAVAAAAEESIPWEFQTDQPVIAIGDIHGNFDALSEILRRSRVVNNYGDWSLGTGHVVLIGDLLKGKKDSRLVLDYVIGLQLQARKAGGHLHVVLGNHELRVARGDVSSLKPKESEKFLRYPINGQMISDLGQVFLKTHYAEFFAKQNLVIKINGVIYAHAGLDSWALSSTPGEINARARDWIRFWQGGGARPDPSIAWVIGAAEPSLAGLTGPSWQQGFKIFQGQVGDLRNGPSPEVLEQILKQWGASRLIVGHTPTPDSRLALEHPKYGKLVSVIDVRLSEPEVPLQALHVMPDGSLTPLAFTRPSFHTAIRQAELGRLRMLCRIAMKSP